MQSLQPMLFKRYLPDNPIKLEKNKKTKQKQKQTNTTPRLFKVSFFFFQLLVKDTIKAGPGYLKWISFMAKNVSWVFSNLM